MCDYKYLSWVHTWIFSLSKKLNWLFFYNNMRPKVVKLLRLIFNYKTNFRLVVLLSNVYKMEASTCFVILQMLFCCFIRLCSIIIIIIIVVVVVPSLSSYFLNHQFILVKFSSECEWYFYIMYFFCLPCYCTNLSLTF